MSAPSALVLGFGLGAFLMGPVRAIAEQHLFGRAAIDPNA